MVEEEFVKWLATLGTGGMLAAIMFWFYRKDVARFTEMWQGQSDALLEVVKDNTTVITKLVSTIEELHRRLDEDSHERNRLERKIASGGRGQWRTDSEQK